MSSLFEGFDKVSSKQWKQKIQVDLKGADYNEALKWNSNEGIAVKPFYHYDEQISYLEIPKVSNWKITEYIEVHDSDAAIENANKALKGGAESFIFEVWKSDDVKAIEDFTTSINNPVFILNKTAGLLHSEKVTILQDIIGHLGATGNWYNNLKSDHEELDGHVNVTEQLVVNSTHYQNAGANSVQQVAYALAHANEYFNHYDSSTIRNTIYVNSVGGNYFFEIAKLRALRYLHKEIADCYDGISSSCEIISLNSLRNKSIYDYNSNILRGTTESMSAVLGGSDFICNLPYDHLYHHTNDFGNRIARNQLQILRNESYFNSDNDACQGAYYIEQLTKEIADKALTIFKEIEAKGGFFTQLKNGVIQRKIKESANREQEQFDQSEFVLVGSNKYQNTDDRMSQDLEKSPFLKMNKRKTLIEPILLKRLSENIEKERLRNE
ncbi:MAG: methylmalonyl-CoA mutase family protein [bacterium]